MNHGKEFDKKMKEAVISDNKSRVIEIEILLNFIKVNELETASQIKGMLHNRLEELKINGAKYERQMTEICNV